MKTKGSRPVKSQKTTRISAKECSDINSEIRKGLLLELKIELLDMDGRGVSRASSGVPVLVSGTLPGDRCLARISHVGKNFISATVVRFLAFSELRTEEIPCPDAETCMGCPLILMKYPEQIRWKHQQLLNEVAAYSSLKDVKVLPPLSPAKELAYRTTSKLAIAGSFSEPYIGIYRRASHDVVDLDGCPVHHPLVNSVVNSVRRGITKLKVPVWQEKNRTGVLRYLVVRVSESTNEAMVTFVTARRAFNEIHHLSKFLQQEVPQVKVVCQNVNNSDGNFILGSNDHFITKQKSIQERIGTVLFEISHRSFLQAQNDGARLIYETVAGWAGLDGKQSVLDLYCGIGGIALTLAGMAGNMLGIEINPDAVADARRNARLNRLGNCRFEAGDAADLLDELAEDGATFDLITLNPPRKGCDRDILSKIVKLRPARVIYVSCSPETLTRDLDILASSGYRCLKIQPVDMFPQTPHIENIALVEPL